ncbi:MAG: gamma carbonic anhydrase family protein [Neisseria sp.]|nr:gamma carbonic anhydrase family protein [Neisseria sp.]
MNIRTFCGSRPRLGTGVYVDSAALLIGRVFLADWVSVWPFAVLRGDVQEIRVGARSNIQDGCVLHVSGGRSGNPRGSPLVLGEEVTVGHRAVLHGCTIGSRVLVGMGAVILDDAVVGDDVIIGAGSLVAPRKRLESGFLYTGSPARAVRPLTDEERAFLPLSAAGYVETAQAHAGGVPPNGEGGVYGGLK